MIIRMLGTGFVIVIALAGLGLGGGCEPQEIEEDVNGNVQDAPTAHDLPDVGGWADVESTELEDSGAPDVATPDIVSPDSDVATPDVDFDDVPEQDSIEPDEMTEDNGCEPSCQSVECGPDPVCGVVDCGTCGDGLGCVAGTCSVVGCYSPLEYICDESYAAKDGGAPDLGTIRDECGARGASWQACPTGDRVLTVGISKPDGSSMVRHYYSGLYCGAGDAMGMAAFEFGVVHLDPMYMDTPSRCSSEMIDSTACVKLEKSTTWCVELAGGVPVDKAEAFDLWCDDFAGGTSANACPVNEGGACEIAPSYPDAWHTVIHFFPSGDPSLWQVGDLSAQESQCSNPSMVWIPAVCSEEQYVYGTCSFMINTCEHLNGDWDEPYWEVWVTDYDAGAQGMGVSCISLDDATNMAMNDLGRQINLAGCLGS